MFGSKLSNWFEKSIEDTQHNLVKDAWILSKIKISKLEFQTLKFEVWSILKQAKVIQPGPF